DLFDQWARSFTGGLLVPLFRAGALEAEVDRAEAIRNQRVSEYGQATLIAFREVEDALVREAKQRERIRSLERQVELADQSYEQLRIQYFNGLGDYIDVLVALTERQQLRRDLIAARRALLEFRIGLYRALAGGFETEREDVAAPSHDRGTTG
ncbi:MAG: TolC family protein, partial [Thermoanaerobaculia bacterium]|nr:TolC family protein [Thermoanaerobaculia bacterium]